MEHYAPKTQSAPFLTIDLTIFQKPPNMSLIGNGLILFMCQFQDQQQQIIMPSGDREKTGTDTARSGETTFGDLSLCNTLQI